MLYRIFKYFLEVIKGQQIIKVPTNSILLCAKNQHNFIVVYFKIPIQSKGEHSYAFKTIPTGFEAIEGHYSYLDSVVMPSNEVWHIFYEKL